MAVLQMLHIFWAYFILRMAHKFITGKLIEDERSDREETESSEGEETAAGAGAKSRLLANGHPILNNNHPKNDWTIVLAASHINAWGQETSQASL